MPAIFNYLWRLWIILVAAVLFLLFFLPVYLLSIRKEHYKFAYFFVRTWCRCVFAAAGFRYELIRKISKQLIDNQPYIIISNHYSIMDIMLIPILFPRHPVSFVGKAELAKIPFFATIYKRICILVDRKSARSRHAVYGKTAERLRAGTSVIIFPEGGVPDDTSVLLDDFKNGAFSISAGENVPIAVLALGGLKEMFPFDNSRGYPGKAVAFFLDILQPNPDFLKTKEAAHGMISDALRQYYLKKN
ncbi:lysophospholipid acyltransferase family protein [Cruoricaptor ignavus]|uniref:lysophospholipid acyltransferase family protein n=1 Tax=Cruoricaptor ignavus TaxID=1118202 RepID=UPI00370D434B